MAFRHPATALSLALFLFNLVHSLNLLKSLKLWIFIIHHTVSPFQVHVSLPSVSSFKPLITGYERTGPKCCATHSGSPPGLTGTLGTVFQWPETHLVVLSPSPCSPFVQKDIIRNLLRCPAEIQIHCICSISWGKSLIWSDYSWTHVGFSWFLLPSPILEHQHFTSSSNISAKFCTKHTGLKLEIDLFLQIRTVIVYFVDSRTISIYMPRVTHSFSKCL